MSTMATSVRMQAKACSSGQAARRISQRLLLGLGLLEWVLFVVPLYGCVVLLRDGLRVLPVRSLVIAGALHHMRPEEVRATVDPFVGQGLLLTPIDSVAQALSRHPWVEHVEVARLWPNRLQIKIKERMATARWGRFLLDEQGRPFQVPQPWPSLPQLGGSDVDRAMVFKRFLDLARQCQTAGVHLEALHLDAAAWRARVSGVDVLLGTQAPLADMTTYLRLVYPLVRAQQQVVERIDLRYRGAFAMRLREPDSRHDQKNGLVAQGQQLTPEMGEEAASWPQRLGEQVFPIPTGGKHGQET